ncbi:follicle cell protein 3C-1 [Anabrus simplex]|uniref:follicle cell protein 3C-1 n=1 Tax=Anabrus simplex TaxID=316456 RepID=UPI0034DD85A5
MMEKLVVVLLVISAFVQLSSSSSSSNENITPEQPTAELATTTTPKPPTPCTCAVFLSGSFKTGEQPRGPPALLHEHSDLFPNTAFGNKQCTNRCLDIIVRHLPNSPSILCGSIDRDCHRERAYLFIKNGADKWVNTNLSAGREFCCKDGLPYKCPYTF